MARSRLALFGGATERERLSDTWEYESTPLQTATYAAYGNGCAGTAGVPVLRSRDVPQLGTTVAVTLTSARANAAVLACVGTSRTAWGSLALPIDLGPLGAPGCAILTSIEGMSAITTGAAGSATLSLSIPTQGAFIGYTFYNQFLVMDATANPLGVATSNGGRGVVGN